MNTNYNFRVISPLQRWFLISLFVTCFSFSAWAQNVTVSGANSGNGSYATLQAAFAAINVAGNNGSGAISVVLSGNTTETGTAVLDNFTWASVTVTAIVPVTVSGSVGGALIKLNGADNVTVDGRIAGSGRNITIQNNSTATGTASIWLASVAAGNGATNNTIRNLELACGVTQNTAILPTFGIIMSGTTISVTSNGTDNDNNTFRDNRIIRCRYGIVTRGTTTNLNENVQVLNNMIGPAAFGSDEIGKVGILMQADKNSIVSGNTVQNVGGDFANTSGGADRMGIAIGNESWSTAPGTITSTNYTVTNNTVSNIVEERTFSAVGINLATTNGTSATNNLVANNFIYNVKSNGTGGDQGVGIGIAGGNSDLVVYNSIRMAGDVDPNPSASATTNFGSGIRIANANGTTHLNLTLRNNIVYMDLSSSSTSGARYYAISGPSAAYSFGTGGENYNDYYINPLNSQCLTGGLGTTSGNTLTTQFTTLANWQGAYTSPQDANSIQADPGYVSSTDLHISLGSTTVNNVGTPVLGVTIDFDGDSRHASTPDMGADEYTPVVCAAAAGGTITPSSVSRCDGQIYTMTSTGAEIGAGIIYQWEISSTGGGSGFINVSGGIGANTASYTTSTLSPGVYFYRLRVDCSNGPVTGYSNELTVTVNANPVASVDVPISSYCNPNGAPVSITASSASNVAWSPAAGLNTTSGATVSASPTITTTYTATVTDANACTASATSVITVLAGMGISAITATPATVCNGGNSQLQVTAAAAGANTAAGTIYSATTGAFELIPAPVSVITPTTGTIDDGFEPVNTTGSFAFNYNGTNYNNFVISTNGYVVMGATAPALNGIVTSLTSTVLNGFNAIIGYGRDGNINPTNGGSINHGLDASGTKYVFEYFNFATATGGNESATQMANFQIVLWGNASPIPGKIELIYGTSVGIPATVACLGLRDASGTTAFKNALTGSSTVASTTSTFPLDQTMYTFERQTYSYAWTPSSFIAGQETLSNPLATGITATAVYSVTATASNGCSMSGNVTVTAEPLVCTAATISPVNCANTNFSATANHSGGGAPYSYSWDDGAGGMYPNSANITVNLPAGSYTLTCTVSDACASNCTSSVPVTVNANPVTTVTPNTGLICNPGGSAIALSAGGAATYTWSPAAGLSAASGDNVSANPLASTSYTVMGTDGNGCTSIATAMITVNTTANISASATPATICSGDASTLTAVSGTTGSATVGTATTSIGGVNGNPYRSGNGVNNQIRTQLLYTAAELTAAGVQAGPLSSIGFTTQSSSTGTVINFSIGLANTSITALTTTFATTPVTTVFTQASFTPLSSGLNNHVFNAGAFSWDGVSSILVNVCQTNSITGTATVSAFTPATLSNNHRSSLTTSCSELTGTTVVIKPIVRFGWTPNTASYTWGWEPGSLSGNSVSVNPANTTTYTVTATSAGGCTSVASITVIVNQPSSGTTSATACDTYTWPTNGQTYTSSGQYTRTYLNSNGCLSYDTIDLIILLSTSASVSETAYGCYTWPVNGINYSNSGTYLATILNAAGCDSVITLNLTIIPAITVKAKAMLSGPYDANTGLMHDSLRVMNQIPLTEPYSSAPYNLMPLGETSGESISSSLVTITGSNAIVDWVVLELRSAANSATVLANKRALIQRDGDIVSHLDGSSPVAFTSLSDGNYYVTVKHRNHLGIMTANTVALGACSSAIDLTSDPLWVKPGLLNAPSRVYGSVKALWSSDANRNKNSKYNGVSNDKETVLMALGGIGFANSTLSPVYRPEDLNMDGKVRYNNTDNDRLVIINTVGVTTPNAIVNQHTPN